MAEPERKCATCKFYEPAPIWRKGWCRNPLLYAPQQSHLVAEDDLDCSRGLSDYWEAADGTGPNAGVNIAASGSGRDFFDRGGASTAGGSDAEASDNPWILSRNTESDSSYGGAGGYNSGYSTIGQAVPPLDDDGYAPQESAGNRPAQPPLYLGSVGNEDDANDVRNPWDNSQRGYASPPTNTGNRNRDRYGDGTYDDPATDNRSGYGTAGYEAPAAYGAGVADEGYGQPPAGRGGYDAAQGSGYGPETENPGNSNSNGYGASGGYGQANDYGAEQGGYGQGGYGAAQGSGYGQGGYDAAGYGAPPTPPPSVGGTRAPAAGNTIGGRRVTAAPQGRERALTYYTEERYWTDYAKLAVPVVVVLALLGAIWFIGTGRINGGKGNATGTPGVGTVTAVAGAGTGTPRAGTPSATGSAAAGTPRNGVTTIAGASTLPIATVGMGTPPSMPGMTAPVTGPVTTGGSMTVVTMTKFKVANTGGAGANMRADATTSAAVVSLVPEGTEVQQIGGPQTASDGVWYKVQFGDKQGWIRNDFLAPVTG